MASGRGFEDEAKKEEVMKTLMEFGTSQEDIDSLYAQFGEKCLVSVEKFYEYSEIREKKIHHPKSRSRHYDRNRHGNDSSSRSEREEPSPPGNNGTAEESCGRDERRGRPESPVDVMVGVPGDEDAEQWTYLDEADEIKEHIVKYGLRNIKGVLQKNMDSWKEKPLNVAITGMSGKGKSSLINALRNMEPDDEGAAEVDEIECTTVCRRYPHPEHQNFVFWDVPGAGTPKFPKETYLQDIKVDRYDFFMIISSERFSEIDSWLAKEIKARGKHFYFVRTKIDVDMENKRIRLKEKFNETREFGKMKSLVRDQLAKDFGTNDFHLFMISNHHPNRFDFPVLLHQLLNDIPKEKKMALVFGLAGMSRALIEEKASALSARIWKCALASGVAAAIPIPFVSSSIDVGIILEEVLFYRHQFALDDDSLTHLAHMANMKLDDLKKEVKFTTPESIFTAGGLTRYLAKYAAGEVAEKVAQYTLPVIGIAVACGISFASTMSVLQGILDMMKKDAIDVLVYVTTRETEV